MKTPTLKLTSLALGLTLLLATGCGGNQAGNSTQKAGTQTQAASSSSDTPTSKEGELRFAMSGMYKPFNYIQDGELVGFDVEIGKALAQRMGMKPVPVTNPWETIIQGLKAGRYDAIIGSMAITEKRKEQVNFSRPYYRSGAQIFVQEGNTAIQGPDELKGKKIGVVKASTFRDVALKLTDQDKVIGYDSDVIALQDLETGRLDAVITDQVVGLAAMKEGLKIKDVGKPLYVDEMAIAIRKEDIQLLEDINKALNEIIKDGTYQVISEKWFGRSILGE